MDKWIKAGVIGTYLCFAAGICDFFWGGRNSSAVPSAHGGVEVNHYIPFVLLLIATILMLATAAIYKGLWPRGGHKKLEILAPLNYAEVGSRRIVGGSVHPPNAKVQVLCTPETIGGTYKAR